MNEYKAPAVVQIIVEGATEAHFVKSVLKPRLKEKGVVVKLWRNNYKENMEGNVSLERLMNFICEALSSSNDYVTTMFDFYGCKPKNWASLQNANRSDLDSVQKSKIIADDLKVRVQAKLPKLNPQRFIPYVSMYEFEALLFSDPKVLAFELDVPLDQITKILTNYPTPEEINNSVETAPSKRLEKICQKGGRRAYDKTFDGKILTSEIGIEAMRAKCPLFNAWIESLENLSPLN